MAQSWLSVRCDILSLLSRSNSLLSIMGSSLHVRFLIGMVFFGELRLFFKTLGDVSPFDFSNQFYRFLLGPSGAGWSV
jgi:hypothetical protein